MKLKEKSSNRWADDVESCRLIVFKARLLTFFFKLKKVFSCLLVENITFLFVLFYSLIFKFQDGNTF